MSKKTPIPTCAICPVEVPERICRQEEGKAPGNCPSTRSPEIIKETLEILKDPQVMEAVRQASIQEGEGYGDRDKGYANIRPIKPRIQETIEFAQKMKFKRICLIFCIGMRKEAEIIHQIFRTNGFETISVMCKAGAISKEEIGLLREQQIDPENFEAMCNPILQALTANHHESDMNVLFGLCVGHDALFLRYAKAFNTVLASKDRLLAHNPLAAIYQYDSYYRYLKNPI
ncbi:MAG: metal-binding protein [Desulfuromonas sp.]|nr:MAG: metal-binding protein [Desulfuromonas sp.]